MISPIVRRGLFLLPFSLLAGCDTIVLNPSGDIAAQQGQLVIFSTLLMLLIVVPVIALVCIFAWRYRKNNTSAKYDPEWDHSTKLELLIWGVPLLLIIVLGVVTWISTHKLDPYRPLDRIDAKRPIPADVEPLVVQVVALDWKWLFIYPEQNIATVNELVTPIDVPIRFKLCASTVMNSFYIPALAGQIYAMPGMDTTLNAVLNKPGEYEGFSANYSGAGFSHMRFKYHGVSAADFEGWVQKTKAGGGTLDRAGYLELVQPSERDPVRRYGAVTPNLYDAIVNRCVVEGAVCMKNIMAADAARTKAAIEDKEQQKNQATDKPAHGSEQHSAHDPAHKAAHGSAQHSAHAGAAVSEPSSNSHQE
jgi:cytochrome o ubiquinol oxidase subunit 2